MLKSNFEPDALGVLDSNRSGSGRSELRPTKRSVLIIDDEKDVVELLSYNLEREHLEVIAAADESSGLEIALEHRPDVILVDQNPRGIDGLSVCRRIRADQRTCRIPIIMLSTAAAEIDRIIGLESGCDDYVTKPFSPGELVARIRAALRRNWLQERPDAVVRHGNLIIDTARHSVSYAGIPIRLTASEFRILIYLSGKSPRVVSRDEIIERALGSEVSILARAIDVHVSTLRRKLGKGGNQIQTVRGFG